MPRFVPSRPRVIGSGLLTAIIAASFCLVWTAMVGAQQPSSVFLSLVDASGTPVTDLQPAEVSLKQGGVACEDVKLAEINWPMKLTVMVDNGAGTGDFLGNQRSALRAFFEEIPEGVEISLVTTAPQPRFVVRPTKDRTEVMKGIDRLAPDSGAARFVDALIEAAERVDKDKTDHFPALMAIATDRSAEGSNVRERDLQRLLKQIDTLPVTVHVVLVSSTQRASNAYSGTVQLQVGMAVTKASGGRYASIATASTLPALLREYGRQILVSQRRQSHQYRLRCNRWAAPVSNQTVSVATTRPGVSAMLTANGRVP